MIYVIIGVVIVVILLALYIMSTYNSLVRLRNKVRDQWSQIEVVLKRRFDLVPNLVETVKGYAGHERDTLEAIVNARNKAVSATTPKEEMESSNELSGALSRLFALSESYPDLKANTNFLDLQAQLKDTEDKIAYSRQFYNDVVLSYRDKIEMFPSNIVASLFGFKSSDALFFETDEKSKENPQVKF